MDINTICTLFLFICWFIILIMMAKGISVIGHKMIESEAWIVRERMKQYKLAVKKEKAIVKNLIKKI